MSDQLREAAERKKLQLFAKRYLEDIEVGVQPPDGMVFVLATYAAEQLTGDGGRQSISDWMKRCPAQLHSALQLVSVMNKLRDARSECFQMVGKYDGAMSEGCKSSFANDSIALAEFIAAINRTPTPTT